MNRAPIITLFGEAPTVNRGPSSFAVSLLIHGAVFSSAIYLFHPRPRILEGIALDHEPVRIVNLNAPPVPPPPFPQFNAPAAPSPQPADHSAQSDAPASSAALAHVQAQSAPAPQTLINPNTPPRVLLKQETPLPLVVLWSPEPAPVREVVPPPAQEPTAANAKPSLSPPNHEPDLADIQISSAPGATDKLTLPPTSSAPLVVLRPAKEQQVPETSAVSEAQPTPAAVISISNLKLNSGKAILPPANQTAVSPVTDSLHSGHAASGSAAEGANPDARNSNSGAGKNPSDRSQANAKGDSQKPSDQKPGDAASAASATNPSASPAAPAHRGPVQPAPGTVSNTAIEPVNDPTVAHISLPADGHYGAVVVGSSLTEAFPEAEGIMTTRLAYTVYLQVGLARNWILQYALAASADRGSNSIRPDAPWPYEIFRPTIKVDDVGSDAILIHGQINTAGHFEQMNVVYPPQFAQSRLVLDALAKWQFRPAMQKGLSAPVEVLLIIPVA